VCFEALQVFCFEALEFQNKKKENKQTFSSFNMAEFAARHVAEDRAEMAKRSKAAALAAADATDTDDVDAVTDDDDDTPPYHVFVRDRISAPARPRRQYPWVSIESPFWPKNCPAWLQPFRTLQHYQYAVLAYKHEAGLGNMPFASHITYTQWCMAGLNTFAGDGVSEIVHHFLGHMGVFSQVLGRDRCIAQSNDVRRQCDAVVVYTDFGEDSSGVREAVRLAAKHKIPVVRKKLPPALMAQVVGRSDLSTVVPLLCMVPPLVGAAVMGRGAFRFARTMWRLSRRPRHQPQWIIPPKPQQSTRPQLPQTLIPPRRDP
jgi:hypothetical protein